MKRVMLDNEAYHARIILLVSRRIFFFFFFSKQRRRNKRNEESCRGDLVPTRGPILFRMKIGR